MRTEKQIKEQIELLKLQREAIPSHSGFGDDNHGSIDAQVQVLGKGLKLDEDRLEELRDSAYDGDSEALMEAYDWLLEQRDEPLVEPDDLWVERARAKRKAKGGK